MITFAYAYKIKPSKRQVRQIEQYLDICRSVYNYAHAERKAWLDSRKSLIDRCSSQSEYIIPADTPFPGYNLQAKALTEAKKKLPHLKLVNALACSKFSRDWLKLGLIFSKYQNEASLVFGRKIVLEALFSLN